MFAMSSTRFATLILLGVAGGAALISVMLRASRLPAIVSASVAASIEQGGAERIRAEDGQSEPVGAAMALVSSDRIQTAPDGLARIAVGLDALLFLDHDTHLTLERYEQDVLRAGKTIAVFGLSRGRVALFSETMQTVEHAALVERLPRDDEFVEQARGLFVAARRNEQAKLREQWAAIAGPVLPGSLLFPFKRTGETLRVALTTGDRGRLLLRRAFLYRRLAEWFLLRERQSPHAARAERLMRASLVALSALTPPDDIEWTGFVQAWGEEVSAWESPFTESLHEPVVKLFSALPPPPPAPVVASSTPAAATVPDASSEVPNPEPLILPTLDLTPTGTMVQ